MTLIRTNESLFPSWWNGFFDRDWLTMPDMAQRGTSVPAVNIRETDEQFEVEMAAPGMKKDDFSVNLENKVLTISAEDRSEHTEKADNGRYTRQEFSFRAFRRAFTLPENAEEEGISASYEDGVLRITIPRTETARLTPTKTIKVS